MLGVASTLVAVSFGCGHKSDVALELSPPSTMQGGMTAIRSMTDLRMALVPGMPTNDLVTKFGLPQREEKSGGGLVWRYGTKPFPADEEMRGTYVIAVVIGVTNGNVSRWGCEYVEQPTGETVADREVLLSTKSNSPSTSVKFFVLSSNPVEKGKFIDTERLPKLGFISAEPDLAIGKFREVVLEERKSIGQNSQGSSIWVFSCRLEDGDAAKLKIVTTANVNRQFLIMVGDEPVVAATIMAPLETGSFDLECQDRPQMESIKKQLAGMEKRRP